MIHPFAAGQGSLLFANTVNSVKVSALLLSLVESVKANGLNPEDYLYLVIERAPIYFT